MGTRDKTAEDWGEPGKAPFLPPFLPPSYFPRSSRRPEFEDQEALRIQDLKSYILALPVISPFLENPPTYF